jgi:formylglycine-generating enzyme required for sulfatase activity/serine/threonine protein kinase
LERLKPLAGDASGLLKNSLQTFVGKETEVDTTASIGTVIAERYELLEEIGRGGFAAVYKARDRKLNRTMAIKRLLADKSGDAHTVERFKREAQAIAALNHRNIVQVFDHDRDGDGYYIVMEYVEGGTLRDHLKGKGKLSVEESLKLMRGICQGLALAHRKNLVHRDIKPANILLHQDDGELVPKIVDFGLARAGFDSSHSLSGYGMGTPYYMPPEQRRDAKSVNHTADIYALGKTLYEMLTGEIPDTLDADKIPPPPQLVKIINKCCKAKPEERYFSVDELLRELEAVGGGHMAATPVTVTTGNVCPACGRANHEEAKFCEACGGGLTRLCPECEKEYSVQKKFCTACGTDGHGFLSTQDTLKRMERFSSEKNWSRVTKEYDLLAKEVRLPGKKGRKLRETIQALNQQAAANQARVQELRQSLEKAAERSAWTKALEAARALTELEPGDELTRETIPSLEKQIEEEAFQKVLAKTNQLLGEEKLAEAVAEWEKHRKEHPDGSHNREVASRVSNLQGAQKLLEPLQAMVRRAEFTKAEGGVIQLGELTQSEPLRNLWNQRVQGARGKYEAAMERARAAEPDGRFSEAMEALKAALAICPESQEAKSVLGKSNDGIEDDRLYKEALHSSENKRQSKDFIEAREALQLYLKARPHGRHAAEARGSIEQLNQDAQAEKRRRLRKRLVVAGVIAVLVIVGVVWGQIASWQRDREQREQAERNRIEQQAREQAAKEQVARDRAAGRTQLDLGRGVRMELVFIAPGEFLMGSNESNYEKPIHTVRITRGFWMGKYEVTQEQWEAVMGNNPSNFKGAQNPVEKVSWNNATEFCRKTGTRLPTEAEWEYACRAGTTTKYSSGDSDSDLNGVAWYFGNSGRQTHTVGQKAANPWGLYDMHGNVWEWCADWYADSYYQNSPGNDPTGPPSGSARVLRGGSWYDSPGVCRSAFRNWFTPDYRNFNFFGFRVCLDSE